MEPFLFPADVPEHKRSEFYAHYQRLTFSTGHLLLFAADHKIEHLDADFFGPEVSQEAHDPRHLFEIASNAPIGGFATQLGLISRYGFEYPSIPYVIKLNSKTNLVTNKDPLSTQLWTIDDVVAFKESSSLVICAVGVTVYLGSEYENSMLLQAAQMIFHAHQNGLVAILWMYPRGSHIKNDRDHHLLAGAVGVAAALGADFVKIHPPAATQNKSSAELLAFLVEAAGNTKVICAGGEQMSHEKLLIETQSQMRSGSAGAAIGRNIFQHSQSDALKLTTELSKIIYGKEV
jgi:fructose-bisphosphate aldolase / 6-deoxy-5-ketofructose 1-phosphate synthase